MNFNNQWNIKLVPNCYSCIWCDVTFNNPDVIRFHVRNKHPFHCNSCLKAMTCLFQFSQHATLCRDAQKELQFYQLNQLLQHPHGRQARMDVFFTFKNESKRKKVCVGLLSLAKHPVHLQPCDHVWFERNILHALFSPVERPANYCHQRERMHFRRKCC